MKAKEIIVNENVNLFEINMSPVSLRQLAASIDARAGMEFEMAVPIKNFVSKDIKQRTEPDYSYDVRPQSIDDVIEFFSNQNYRSNSKESINNLKKQLQLDYEKYINDFIASTWNDYQAKFVAKYVEENDLFDYDVAYKKANHLLKKSPVAFDEFVEYQLNEFIRGIIDNKDTDSRASEIYTDAMTGQSSYDQIVDDTMEYMSERRWLVNNDLWMADLETKYNLTWPHYKPIAIDKVDPKITINAIGDSFSRVVNKTVNISDRYHAAPRTAGQYALEPDTSISPENSSDQGLEFVSPPQPLDEMLLDLRKTIQWAKTNGCYTNESTGLHMNVSVAGLSGNLENLDFVKLVLLIGDEHVLKQFSRQGNVYAKSSMQKLKSAVARKQSYDAKVIEEFLIGMGFRLQDMASNIIASPSLWEDKYFSVHAKEGYIEFRSPGGDWLNFDINKLESTLLRFVVALDAAMDPEKYRQEYLKKLYKLLQVNNKEDPLFYFAKYAAGQYTINDLRDSIYNLYSSKHYVRMDKKPKLPDSTRKETLPEKRWGVYAPQISPDAANLFVTAPDNYKIIKIFNASTEKEAKFKAKIWISRIKDIISSGQFAMIGPIEIVPYDK